MEEEKAIAKIGRTEIDKFVNDKSVLGLVDTIMYLDTLNPYVSLSQNGEVGEILQKRNIPVVHNKADFDYLYESLRNRVTQLAGKDERVKTYVQRAEYQKQMTQLPVLMSKLERISFDELKPAFKAVMEYVYDAGMNGFYMEDKICINKKGKFVNLYFKDISLVLFKKKNRSGGLKFRIINIIGRNYRYGQVGGYRINSPEGLIDEMKKRLLSNPKLIPVFKEQMSNILNLPKIMNDYLKETIGSLDVVVKELKEKNGKD